MTRTRSPSERYRLDDRVAIVTGASRGIGRSVAEQFVADGASVVLCSRTRSDLEEVVEGLPDEMADRAVPVECDITDRTSVDSLVEATVEAFGRIDVLVNNAGGSFPAPFEELSENAWKAIVDLNLHGTFNCIQAAGEHLRSGGGVVVNVASDAGLQGAPELSHYGAAKAGVINLTRSLACEWAPKGVRINAVAPGVVATPGIEEQLGVTAAEVDRMEVDRRVATPDEIADVVHFLASPVSSYVVGETVPVRGVPSPDSVDSP